MALLGSFLTLSTFKEELSVIKIYFSDNTISLLSILLIFGSVLILSAYFYALDYVRYNFGKYQNLFLFRLIIPTADFFYSISILFPIFIFILWVIAYLLPYLCILNTKYWVELVILLMFVLSIVNTRILSKNKREEEGFFIEKQKEDSLRRATDLLNKDFFGESLVESFRALEFTLREKLFEKQGFDSKYLNINNLLWLASKNQVVDQDLIPKIKEIQRMRNKFMHEYIQVTKEQAESAIETIRKIRLQ